MLSIPINYPPFSATAATASCLIGAGHGWCDVASSALLFPLPFNRPEEEEKGLVLSAGGGKGTQPTVPGLSLAFSWLQFSSFFQKEKYGGGRPEVLNCPPPKKEKKVEKKKNSRLGLLRRRWLNRIKSFKKKGWGMGGEINPARPFRSCSEFFF